MAGVAAPLQFSHAKEPGSPTGDLSQCLSMDLADEGLQKVLDNLQEMAGPPAYMQPLSKDPPLSGW